MKKINLTDEELEMMNYNDAAYVILEQNGKKMKIIDLLNEVGKLLKLDPEEEQEHITDFFELLSTDKRFIMLDGGFWDLKIKHNRGMVIEEIDDDDEEVIMEEKDENAEEDENEFDEDVNSDDDIEDDDLADLVIIDDSDEENL